MRNLPHTPTVTQFSHSTQVPPPAPPDPLDFCLDNLTPLDPGHGPTAPRSATPTRHSELLAAALAYAARGLFVVPVHEPQFDAAGHLTGCTCEQYKRSERYRAWLTERGRGQLFDPDYKCPSPGKHPRVSDWESAASTDPAQIRAWLSRWPTMNVGIATGKSKLIAFDRDTYKEVYGDDSDLFSPEDRETVTQISQRGGEHWIYAMPEGAAYTNAKGQLPPGIDIRGAGGMIMVEPSVGPTGNQWTWEDGYSILERDPAPLPAGLRAILDAAQSAAPARSVVFTTPTTERPDLIRWAISKTTRERIHAPAPVGQRSESDYSVALALIYAGASDNEILSVFEHYPIGVDGKFAESGRAYLAHTVGRARTWADAHPRRDVGATVEALLLWARTTSFAGLIDPKHLTINGRYVTDATDTKIADAILCRMRDRQSATITIGKKLLGARAGVSCNTAAKALTRLTPWLFTVTPDQGHGATVTLALDSVVCCRLIPVLLGQLSQNNAKWALPYRDQSVTNENFTREVNEYSPRKSNEPFLTGTSRDMRARFELIAQTLGITTKEARQVDDLTHPGLGEIGIRLIDAALREGGGSAVDFSERTGKKLGSVRTALRRLTGHGLFERERAAAREPYIYTLAPDIWGKIDALAPTLRNFTIGARREDRRLADAQKWTVNGYAHAQSDPEKKSRIERRFNRLAKDRMIHLRRVNETLTDEQIEEKYNVYGMIHAYKFQTVDGSDPELFKQNQRSADRGEQIRTAHSAATADHRDEVRMIRELADELGTPGVTLEELTGQICLWDFDRALVNNVLQSDRQMVGFETVASARKRLPREKREPVIYIPNPFQAPDKYGNGVADYT